MKWWGYLHVNNTLKVKRFFDYADIRDAKESPFVQQVFEPFLAGSHENAINKIEKEIEEKIRDRRTAQTV